MRGKVALNVPRILSRSPSRRTTQDALAERAYANPATASQGEIPRTSHQNEKEKAADLLSFAHKKLDKGLAKGIYHKNFVARYKSQLAQLVNNL